MPMPEEIVGLLRSKITFKWPGGHQSQYPARALRLRCRCAGCIEEMSGAAILDPGNIPETIRAKTIELVGQYAIQIFWSDGHETGIYSFRDLRANCPCYDCAEIREAGGTPA